MSIAGTTNVGGRSVSEIADRFLEQFDIGRAAPCRAMRLTSSSDSRDRG